MSNSDPQDNMTEDKGGEYGGLAGTMSSAEHKDTVRKDAGRHRDERGPQIVDTNVQAKSGPRDHVEQVKDPTTGGPAGANNVSATPVPAADSGRTGESAPEVEQRENAPVRGGENGGVANDAF